MPPRDDRPRARDDARGPSRAKPGAGPPSRAVAGGPPKKKASGSRAPRPLSERRAGNQAPHRERREGRSAPAATGPMRLQRALARSGVTSRRAADTLVAEGRVTVNGEPATVGQVVDPARDTIAVDGQAIAAVAPREWLVLHKPPGVLTTRADPEGRPTVFDLVPDRPGLTYVGRLDYMTEGVLLFTTDGDAAHRLTHPSSEVERTYLAVVRGNAPAAVRTLRHGLVLEDGPVEATQVDARPLGNRRWEFELTIAEGRTREVRRICEALELTVERLVRVRFGPVRLGVLPSGEVRALNAAEGRVIDALTQGRSPRALEGAVGDELRAVGREAVRGESRPAPARGGSARGRDGQGREGRSREADRRDTRGRDTRERNARERNVRDQDQPAAVRRGPPARSRTLADRPPRERGASEHGSSGRGTSERSAPARGAPARSGPARGAPGREPRPPGRVPGGGRGR